MEKDSILPIYTKKHTTHTHTHSAIQKVMNIKQLIINVQYAYEMMPSTYVSRKIKTP